MFSTFKYLTQKVYACITTRSCGGTRWQQRRSSATHVNVGMIPQFIFYTKLVKCFSFLSFRSIELQQNRPPIRLRIRSRLPHSPQFSLFSFPLHLMHYQMLHSKILCRQLPQLMRLSCGINKLRVWYAASLSWNLCWATSWLYKPSTFDASLRALLLFASLKSVATWELMFSTVASNDDETVHIRDYQNKHYASCQNIMHV